MMECYELAAKNIGGSSWHFQQLLDDFVGMCSIDIEVQNTSFGRAAKFVSPLNCLHHYVDSAKHTAAKKYFSITTPMKNRNCFHHNHQNLPPPRILPLQNMPLREKHQGSQLKVSSLKEAFRWCQLVFKASTVDTVQRYVA